jgi:pimeloyl-ACP methyl ester carboxylesterase
MDAAKQLEPHEGFVNTPDGKLHYLDWKGSGPQLHLLHANGFCAGTYSPFIRYLVDDFHIFASDVRGHGASHHPDIERIRSWTVFAKDLKTLIEQTMVPPVIGMGHSLGAVTTYIAAAKFPHLFSGIVLIDPVILPYKVLWLIAAAKILGMRGKLPLAKGARRRRRVFKGKKQALKLFAAGRGIFKSWSKEFVQAYLECGLLEKDSETAVLTCDPELEAQIFESVPVDVWRYAKKISCPVLAVRGALSDTFYPDAAQRLKDRISDFELATIPETGHFIPMEKPEKCARVIRDFIHHKIRLASG